MNFVRALQELSRPTPDLTEREAAHVLGALLDDGLPELEQGALLALLEVRPLSLPLLAGFQRALTERCYRVASPPSGVRPIVLAAHCAPDRQEANLLPLLTLLLQRLGLTVLVHGSLEGAGVAGSAHVFRALGIMPCASLAAAQRAVDRERLAFVPTGVLAPGLARLAARRARLGGGRLIHLLERLLDPCASAGLRVVATGVGEDARLLAAFELMSGAHALLLEGTDGEPFASPQRRPVLELVRDNTRERLFVAENAGVRGRTPGLETASVADWTRRALRGEVPLPLPLVNQVACCLYGAGCASDINQAKAIAALETGSLVPA